MKKTDNGYYVNRHSCFLLEYHLVLVTKYRHKVITGDLEEYFKEYAQEYFKKQGLVIVEMETMPDHVHILFDAPPQVNLANTINAFKSASSRMIRNRFRDVLQPYYWKPYFWSLSYFIGSTGEASAQAVKKYIQHQKD